MLATATFTDESASGWEQVDFSQPVAIQAGTTYIASYFTPNGNYADDLTFFAGGSFTNGPLTAIKGVYAYGEESAFPTQTYSNSNYYVDVVFSPFIGSISPAASATGVATDSAVTVQFLASMNASTITSSTLELQDNAGNAVPATVSFDSTTNTATLTPTAALNQGVKYTVVVTGGADGVADSNGDTLSSNATSSFTTQPTAPAVVSVSPAAAATGVDPASSIQIQFNEAMNAASLTSSTLVLQNSSGNAVPATISYNSNDDTATLVPDAPLDNSATYSVIVMAGPDGIADANGNTTTSQYESTFTTAAAASPGTYRLWTDSSTPAWVDNPDPRSVELGVQFTSTASGEITGIRFYQSGKHHLADHGQPLDKLRHAACHGQLDHRQSRLG